MLVGKVRANKCNEFYRQFCAYPSAHPLWRLDIRRYISRQAYLYTIILWGFYVLLPSVSYGVIYIYVHRRTENPGVSGFLARFCV